MLWQNIIDVKKSFLYLDLALIGTVAVGVGIYSVTMRTQPYHEGLGDYNGPDPFMLFLIVGVLTLCCVLGIIISAAIQWAKYGIRGIIRPLVCFALMILGIGVLQELGNPGYLAFTEGFRDRMRKQANLTDIRKWLSENGQSREGDIPESSWPECVSKLSTVPYSNRVYLNNILQFVEVHNGIDRFIWGGGFGRWGIVVGPPTMVTPPSDEHEYRLSLAPGAYVWHEIQ